DEEAIADDGAAKSETRRLVPDAHHMPAPDSKVRKKVVHVEMPFRAAALRFDRHHGSGEASVLREKRHVQNVHRLDRIYRKRGTEFAGCRVRPVALVDDIGAALLGGA